MIAVAVVGYFAYRAAGRTAGRSPCPTWATCTSRRRTSRTSPYNSEPPTSGPHLPYVAPWGIHTEPIVKELQVHNLEDGGVMVQYNCPSGCPDLVAKLRGHRRGLPRPRDPRSLPGMKTRIALTAWTRIDAFDEFDESRISRFIKAYRGIDHHKGRNER